jgi:hypothetical protein
MSRDLFWQATDRYREAESDGWSAFMAFIDERNDYSLGIWEVELDDLVDELIDRYHRTTHPGRRLSAGDLTEACLNVTLRGRSLFETVAASPSSLALHVDSSLMDAWDEDRVRHLDLL